VEDRPRAIHRNPTRRQVVADHMMAESLIEMNTKYIRKQIRVLNIRVSRIVFHENKHAAFLDPPGDPVCIPRLEIMGIGFLAGMSGETMM
jgi:hypothetical protein